MTILCLALRKLRVLTVRLKWRQALATLGILLTLLLATMGIMYAGRGKSFSVYKTFTNVNTSTDSSYKSVGMLATTVQELRYMVFGSSGQRHHHAVPAGYRHQTALQQQFLQCDREHRLCKAGGVCG